jgi:hypothetical protein
MTTLSASEARKRLYNLVDAVKESHAPIQIVGKRNSAVFVSEEAWKAIAGTPFWVVVVKLLGAFFLFIFRHLFLARIDESRVQKTTGLSPVCSD